MKNRINKIIGKLFTVVVLSAALTGAVFAQESLTEKTENFRVRATEPIRRRVEQNTEKWTIKKAVETKELYLSTVNRTNFNLGSEFATALMNAARLDEGDSAAKAAMIDLIYLIDSLENQPEAAAVLQKTLKSIVRGTAKAAQVRLEIESASKSYSSRLTSEQQWYFKSGTAVTELVFSTYASDDAAMKKGLAEIKELIKTAPPKTSGEILVPMNNLAKYIANAAFAENDYAAIFKSAVGLIGIINA